MVKPKRAPSVARELEWQRSHLGLLVCPSCGRHWPTVMALGQWIASCTDCELQMPICWEPDHRPWTVLPHR